ncbi:MAG: hypothetical protein V4478_00420 [Patescibacteria group bacterium]
MIVAIQKTPLAYCNSDGLTIEFFLDSHGMQGQRGRYFFKVVDSPELTEKLRKCTSHPSVKFKKISYHALELFKIIHEGTFKEVIPSEEKHRLHEQFYKKFRHHAKFSLENKSTNYRTCYAAYLIINNRAAAVDDGRSKQDAKAFALKQYFAAASA